MYQVIYGNNDSNKEYCSICCDEIIIDPKNFPIYTLLICSHKYQIHPKCLWAWVLQNNATDRMEIFNLYKQNNFPDHFILKITCPLCRANHEIIHRTL